MNNLSVEMYDELNKRILPYWSRLKDFENGGFYGYVNFDGVINKEAEKGGILNSRILWFFSSVYCFDKNEKALKLAEYAYKFMVNYIFDKEYEGLYWMVDYKGNATDTRKHVYNQAFGIYALSQYYKATRDKEALDLAMKLFYLIEQKCKDSLGYLEEFDRKWKEKENEMLSENGVISDKTMNTHLHILESYTVLYEVSRSEDVRKQLYYVLDIIKNNIYCELGEHLKVFFDKQWNETIDIQSYGHDIEATWLIDRAADILEDKSLIENTYKYTQKIAENIYAKVYSPDGIANETVNGKTDTSRVWWVQAESVIGFYNAYKKSKNEKFLQAAEGIWKYIKNFMVDKRENSEWYWKVDENGEPYVDKPIVEPWKCPYHNGRMCLEIIERMKK